jgi:hypothetical protein
MVETLNPNLGRSPPATHLNLTPVEGRTRFS